jgi:hypothetical protein
MADIPVGPMKLLRATYTDGRTADAYALSMQASMPELDPDYIALEEICDITGKSLGGIYLHEDGRWLATIAYRNFSAS